MRKKLIALCIGAVLLLQPLAFPASANDRLPRAEEPRIIGEDASLRGEYEKHFRLESDDPDEQEMIAVAYGDVVHYQDDSGQWRDIDNTMELQTDAQGNAVLENRDSPFGVELAQNTAQENLITVDNGERSMSYSIQAASMPKNYAYQRSLGNAPSVLLERKELAPSEARVLTKEESETQPFAIPGAVDERDEIITPDAITSQVAYESVLPDTDIRYTMDCLHVNGEIMLNGVPEEDCYILNLDTKGLPARLNEDKSITVYNPETKEEEFYIKAPFLYDEKLEECHNVGVELVETEAGYDVILTLDKAWMESPEREGRAIIAHEIKTTSQDTSNIDDTYVHPGDAAKDHWGEISWKVGVQNGQVHRAFLRFINLPVLPAGYTFTSDDYSYLHLYLVNGTTTTINIQEYGVNSAWSPGTINWNQHNNMSYTYYGDSFAFGVERHQIWVHDQPERYYTERGLYHGLFFKSTDETYQDWNQMYSGNYSGMSSRPRLEIHYATANEFGLTIDTTKKCHLESGVSSVIYYIHPGLNTRMVNLIENAATYWEQALNAAGIPVIFTRTNGDLPAQIRFYDKSLINTSIASPIGTGEAARTLHFHNHLYTNPMFNNWDFSEVYVNQDYLAKKDNYDGAGVMGHEMGHALGLSHTANPYLLMTQLGEGRAVYKPQLGDIAGIRLLYGV